MAQIAGIFGGPSWTGFIVVMGFGGCFQKDDPASSSGTEVLPGDDGGTGDGDSTGGEGGAGDGGGSDDGGDDGGEGGDGVVEDADGDGFSVADGDCDDANHEVHPGAIDTEWLDRDCELGISRSVLSTAIGGDAEVVRLGIGLGTVPDQDSDGGAEVFATSQADGIVMAHVWSGSTLIEGARLGVVDAEGTVALPFSALGYLNAREGGDVLGTGSTTSAVAGPWAGRGYMGVALVDHGRLSSSDTAETAVVATITFVDVGASVGVGQGLAVDADLDGDGFDDLVVGMPFAGEGRACVHLSSSLQSSPFRDNADADVTIVNDIDGKLGEGISTPGDIDGDGVDDLFVGAPYRRIPDAPAADYIGASYLFSGADVAAGRVASVDDAYLSVVGNIGDRMGAEGRLIADVTGDGRPDLVVSGSGASYGADYAQRRAVGF